jgi:hypothetical protein
MHLVHIAVIRNSTLHRNTTDMMIVAHALQWLIASYPVFVRGLAVSLTIVANSCGLDCTMSRIIDFAAPLGQKAGSGRWNDLDMLEVGNGGMTYDEYGACSERTSQNILLTIRV